jgi:hypothetical protein
MAYIIQPVREISTGDATPTEIPFSVESEVTGG